ncbi:prepilin peptidase [Candidatus Uhrbacteria bacterium]|nr:prepilin peptidase [Candidatus Uhrbacteria bacterium]
MFVEQVIGWIFGACLGACLGSFSNVIAIRWHAESTVFGRSACPSCKRQIKARHLVPIFSWLYLRGHCSNCGKKIHVQYPLVELAGLLLGLIAAIRHEPFSMYTGPQFWFELIFSTALLAPLVMDIRWKVLPVEYLGGLSIIAAIINVIGFGVVTGFGFQTRLASVILGMAFAGLFFAFQVLASRGNWLGIGDIWLGVYMGAVLGWPLLPISIYLAYLIGGSVAIGGLLLGSLHRGDRLPFAPALVSGMFAAMWIGPLLYDWILTAWT